MAGRRVVIVVNKWWEADPLCSVLIHDKARPREFSDFVIDRFPARRAVKPVPGSPRPPDPPSSPRLKFDYSGDAVELWCLEELMNPAESSSSSAEKARVLPGVFAAGAPALTVAFGTAGIREGVHVNGSVVIGGKTFIHDPFGTAPNRAGMWKPPKPDVVVDSTFGSSQFRQLDEQARYAAEARFLLAPVAGARPPLVFIGNGLASLGVVNITNYDDYVWADAAAVRAFGKSQAPAQIASIETTHGIIRSAAEVPFLFVSGITDTEGLFDFEVSPRAYAQNLVAAHNAAVALAWFLPSILGAI
jgi:hypothetical protein